MSPVSPGDAVMTRNDGLMRTRDGDLVEAPSETSPACFCHGGWLGPASLPSPCPTCRPDTVKRLRAERERAKARNRYGETR